MMKSLAFALTVAMLLAGCSTDPHVNMFSGTRSDGEVATLLPMDQEAGSVLMRIDNAATGNCLSNCAFFRPVRVLPGTRNVKVYLAFPPAQARVRTVPQDRVALARATTEYHPALLVNTAKLDSDFTFEAGKRYRIAYGFNGATDVPPLVWWEAVP